MNELPGHALPDLEVKMVPVRSVVVGGEDAVKQALVACGASDLATLWNFIAAHAQSGVARGADF